MTGPSSLSTSDLRLCDCPLRHGATAPDARHSECGVAPAILAAVDTSHARMKLIVIHGGGGTFAGAVRRILDLSGFTSRWYRGSFIVDRRTGSALRQILQAPTSDGYVGTFQKLIVSRFLSSCAEGPADGATPDFAALARFDEPQLLRDFAFLGIPIAPAARQRRGRQLGGEAERELADIMPVMEEIHSLLSPEDGPVPTEIQARKVIKSTTAPLPSGDSLIRLLETIRDMHETGGDLDTVASAVLYTHWLLAEAEADGRELQYGRDYRYVFLNYHESLEHWQDLGPGELYMADIPIAAFPDFEKGARRLFEHGIRIARYEDHHPCTPEQKQMLERLQHEGILGHLALSGPEIGTEMDRRDSRCGADMVYESTTAGRPWDCPGAAQLRRAAHSEDFAAGRCELGTTLTGFIKGGVCKVELAHLLLDSIGTNDALERLTRHDWYQLADARHEYLSGIESSLLQNVYTLRFRRPPGTAELQGGDALGPGSDMPFASGESGKPDAFVRVLVALAPSAEPGMPRITVGRATEFLAREIPDADYLLYCYGSRIVVARRLSQADLTFNLGAMMPEIGGPGDGGHAAAAVCRPESNPAYPARLLGNVSAGSFRQFARYLASRISAMGHQLAAIENTSSPSKEHFRDSGRKLVLVTAAAALVGVALVLLHPRFRRGAIRESNEKFLPQIALDDDTQEAKPE